MASVPVMSDLENYLSLTNRRENVIASNVANVDTPGYKTKDLDFQQELSRAMSGGGQTTEDASTHTVKGLLERPDGNNVDIDRESLLMAEMQLQYQVGTQLMKTRFHELMTAINGGS